MRYTAERCNERGGRGCCDCGDSMGVCCVVFGAVLAVPLLPMKSKAGVIAALILINVLWAGNPVMQKFLLADFEPLQVAWLRMVVGAAVLAAGIAVFRVVRPEAKAAPGEVAYSWAMIVRAIAMGAIVFCLTPILVTHGLNASLAVHNAFITGLEPVITIVLARIVLRERMHATGWIILAIALLGFALLSGVGGSWRALVQATYLYGNVLLLIGMAGEAMYSILGAPLARRTPPVTVFVIALTTGAALLTVALAGAGALPEFGQFTWRSAAGLVWTGPITTTLCYLVWLTSLRHVPVNAAAFSLFVQPVLGAFLGYALLEEKLAGLQWAGAALILLSLVLYAARLRRGSMPSL